MVEVVEIIDAPEEDSNSDNESASTVSGACSYEENWQIETKRGPHDEYDQPNTSTKANDFLLHDASPTQQRKSEETIDELMKFFDEKSNVMSKNSNVLENGESNILLRSSDEESDFSLDHKTDEHEIESSSKASFLLQSISSKKTQSDMEIHSVSKVTKVDP